MDAKPPPYKNHVTKLRLDFETAMENGTEKSGKCVPNGNWHNLTTNHHVDITNNPPERPWLQLL
jgi:hypothetical protein